MKAYVVSLIDVESPERYAEYTGRAPETVVAFGGRYLVRNGPKHQVEGPVFDKRVVLLEFPSVEKARAWYELPAYQTIVGVRHSASKGQMFFVEGYEPPLHS